eukprot:m51a1_g9992 hypothetical protein (677) ;mRNA; r:45773-48550
MGDRRSRRLSVCLLRRQSVLVSSSLGQTTALAEQLSESTSDSGGAQGLNKQSSPLGFLPQSVFDDSARASRSLDDLARLYRASAHRREPVVAGAAEQLAVLKQWWTEASGELKQIKTERDEMVEELLLFEEELQKRHLRGPQQRTRSHAPGGRSEDLRQQFEVEKARRATLQEELKKAQGQLVAKDELLAALADEVTRLRGSPTTASQTSPRVSATSASVQPPPSPPVPSAAPVPVHSYSNPNRRSRVMTATAAPASPTQTTAKPASPVPPSPPGPAPQVARAAPAAPQQRLPVSQPPEPAQSAWRYAKGPKLKQLAWNKLPDGKARAAEFWSSVAACPVDVRTLTRLFQQQVSANHRSASGVSGAKAVTILDQKKGSNISQRTQMELLRAYNGDLHQLAKAEQLFLELLPVPNIPAKFHCVEAALRFDTLAGNIEKGTGAIMLACCQLRGSTLFKKWLEVILAIGNFLNAGSFRGNARGFKLSSLTRLAETRSGDGGTNLLRYMTYVCSSEDGVVSVSDEIAGVAEAAKSGSLQLLQADLAELDDGIKAAQGELSSAASGPDDARFKARLREFVMNAASMSATLDLAVKRAQMEFGSLLEYYGEEPEQAAAPEEFFSTLQQFREAVDAARSANAKELAQEERRRNRSAWRSVSAEEFEKAKALLAVIGSAGQAPH